ELAVEREVADRAATARELAVDAAHGLAVETLHGAKLEIDVEIDVLGLGLGLGLAARNRRFEEAAAVKHVAAHRHLHHAIGAALRAQRSAITVGRRIDREVRIQEIAVLVDLER